MATEVSEHIYVQRVGFFGTVCICFNVIFIDISLQLLKSVLYVKQNKQANKQKNPNPSQYYVVKKFPVNLSSYLEQKKREQHSNIILYISLPSIILLWLLQKIRREWRQSFPYLRSVDIFLFRMKKILECPHPNWLGQELLPSLMQLAQQIKSFLESVATFMHVEHSVSKKITVQYPPEMWVHMEKWLVRVY